MNVVQKLEKTTDNVFGLVAGVASSIDQLDLSEDQIMAFCDATPDGGQLWREFTTRRDGGETKEHYGFADYMKEVLSNTDYPVS